jgi:hypothetical protein
MAGVTPVGTLSEAEPTQTKAKPPSPLPATAGMVNMGAGMAGTAVDMVDTAGTAAGTAAVRGIAERSRGMVAPTPRCTRERTTIAREACCGQQSGVLPLDSWQAERVLEQMAVPARRVLAGWILAAVLAIAAVFGPSATSHAVHGLLALRQDILMLDQEFDRMSLLFRPQSNSASRFSRSS